MEEPMEINEFFQDLTQNLKNIQSAKIENLIELIYKTCINNKSIFIIGNGGSASNASHFSQDLSRINISYNNSEKRIKAFSLTDNVSFISAVANDFGFDNIFTSQLKAYANTDDVLIAISCSGNSENIIQAVNYAKLNNIRVVGITGYSGGKLKELSELNIHVPANDFGMVESIHSAIFHFISKEIESRYSTK